MAITSLTDGGTPAATVVVLDANVLFPFSLRDTLLRAAAAGLYRLHWSAEILDEVERNLVAKAISPDQGRRLRAAMVQAFPESSVEGYESLVPSMPNDPKDRHVAAAAVHCGAQLIITSNLRDFRLLPAGLAAKGPDAFLCQLFDRAPNEMVQIIHEQVGDMRRPPVTLTAFLEKFRRLVPEFAALMEAHLNE